MFGHTQEAVVGLLSSDLVFFLHHPMVFLFQTSGQQDGRKGKYAAHSCLSSIDKSVLETGESIECYCMRIPFQPRSDERDIVGALEQLFLRLAIVTFHIRIRVIQPLCQASFFISRLPFSTQNFETVSLFFFKGDKISPNLVTLTQTHKINVEMT